MIVVALKLIQVSLCIADQVHTEDTYAIAMTAV